MFCLSKGVMFNNVNECDSIVWNIFQTIVAQGARSNECLKLDSDDRTIVLVVATNSDKSIHEIWV